MIPLFILLITTILATQMLSMRKSLLLLFVCALFLSCNKKFDDFRKIPGMDLRFCQIKKWDDQHPTGLRHNVFSYNEYGNPTSVTSDLEGTGAGYHYFKYDENQRLIEHEWEFIGTYLYHYEGSDRRPTGNTIVDAYGREFEETFTHDEKGRIVKTVTVLTYTPYEEEEYPDETKEYMYDENNLVKFTLVGHYQSEDVAYTNKPAIYLTNKVWMLVNRNYSKNSPAGAATFTPIGLPLTYHEEPGFQFAFLDMYFPQAKITYECK